MPYPILSNAAILAMIGNSRSGNWDHKASAIEQSANGDRRNCFGLHYSTPRYTIWLLSVAASPIANLWRLNKELSRWYRT